MKNFLFTRILLLSLISFYFLTSCNSDKNLRFVYMGDLHYSTPDFRTAGYLVPEVAKEIDTLKRKAEFVIQTGDFFHGGSGTDVESEAAFAFKNFSEEMKLPFYIAHGNHDNKTIYEKNALPLFSRQLGREITKSYYSFNKANCHFIFLDCTEKDLKEQLAWLKNDLQDARKNSGIGHIFVAGHYPLWIVSRAGFTRVDYAVPVAMLLAEYRVDAYFCGHTHNKSTTVRMINGYPLTQMMDAAVVEQGRLVNLAPFLKHVTPQPENADRPGILSLEEAHQVFIPPSQLVYYWGYQEGSTTSYRVITVRDKSVQVDWHVLGKGIVRSFKWDQPGKLVDLIVPAEKKSLPFAENDLQQIEKAWLYAAPWTTDDSLKAPFTINNVKAGDLIINRRLMAYSPFWNKVEIPIEGEALKALRMENEISITNPGKARFGLAHMFLMVRMKDGRFARTTVSQKVITSFRPEPGMSVSNFPELSLIESTDTGAPLETVKLKFEKYYNNPLN